MRKSKQENEISKKISKICNNAILESNYSKTEIYNKYKYIIDYFSSIVFLSSQDNSSKYENETEMLKKSSTLICVCIKHPTLKIVSEKIINSIYQKANYNSDSTRDNNNEYDMYSVLNLTLNSIVYFEFFPDRTEKMSDFLLSYHDNLVIEETEREENNDFKLSQKHYLLTLKKMYTYMLKIEKTL